MIFFVLFMFILFAIGGLVIDMGLMWVTQSRMRSATDATALEVERWRDVPPDTATNFNTGGGTGTGSGTNPGANSVINPNETVTTQPTETQTALDAARRQAGATLSGIIFADSDAPNYPFASTSRDGQFGAGPIFEQQSGLYGTPEANIGETLSPANPPVYKPALQSNTSDNLDSGDIVAGEYNGASNLAATTEQLTMSHVEGPLGSNDQFSRQDFTAASADEAPTSTAVLVRMRQSLDESVPDVSSTGSPIPFLFSMGTFLQATENSYGYAPRRDGITVRATAIATAIPAVYVGAPIASSGVQGVGTIAFTQAFWENNLPGINNGTPSPVGITVSNSNVMMGGGIVGYPLTTSPQTIGSALAIGATTLPATFTGYFPIYTQLPSGNILVIGFGWAEMDVTNGTVTVTKLATAGAGGSIAPLNASADLRMAWPTLGPPVLSDPDRASVRNANASLQDAVLSPVLVRSMSN